MKQYKIKFITTYMVALLIAFACLLMNGPMRNGLPFIVLLVTGLYMASIAGWFATPWLWQKLMIIGLIILPLEIVDMVLGNWLAAKASLSKQVSARQKRWLAMYHGPFTQLAIILIPLSVVLVMYLAVSKLPQT